MPSKVTARLTRWPLAGDRKPVDVTPMSSVANISTVRFPDWESAEFKHYGVYVPSETEMRSP